MIAEGSLGNKRVDKLLVIRVKNNATMPKKVSGGAAGYDLCSVEDIAIPGKGKGVVRTRLAIASVVNNYAGSLVFFHSSTIWWSFLSHISA